MCQYVVIEPNKKVRAEEKFHAPTQIIEISHESQQTSDFIVSALAKVNCMISEIILLFDHY